MKHAQWLLALASLAGIGVAIWSIMGWAYAVLAVSLTVLIDLAIEKIANVFVSSNKRAEIRNP